MAHPGTAHRYAKKLVAFEHAGSHSEHVGGVKNTLLWIGGLGDGLLTVQYPSAIAKSLPPNWSIAEVLLSSSYRGWGTCSLRADALELAKCVSYFQSLRPGSRTVLMGHSTGCQDIMEYLVGADASSRPQISAVILQGAVSDREACAHLLSSPAEQDALARVLATAQTLVSSDRGSELVPLRDNIVARELDAPMSAYRTVSLLAPGGDDDYFSTDLSDAVLRGTFGAWPRDVRVMFLLGGADPYVAPQTDKEGLLGRWEGFVRAAGGTVDRRGGVVAGGRHNFNGDGEGVVGDLVGRVVGFLGGLEGEGGDV